MKKFFALVACVAFVSAANADLLSFWNFNNTSNDSDLLNSTGLDGLRSGNGHMRDTNAFEDGFLNGGRLYPLMDTFNGDPGALVDLSVRDPGANVVPSTAGFGASIDVTNLFGDNFGSGTSDNWGSFSGTTTGQVVGSFAGGSLVPVGSANNGSYFDIVADLSGWADIDVTWAQRGTSTGFNSRTVSVSTDGVVFTPIYVNAGALTSTWTAEIADAGALLDGASNAIIRFTIDGASSTSGNNRFDNIALNGTMIPEPASLALLVLGGLLLRRR
ncbi:MAG: PEP-CTERM sorting domain-containing protein [Phycisphaerales bacterium]|nr:PEP-CTERM sorting domain-containing protein [Phycisphaerales bacterium]